MPDRYELLMGLLRAVNKSVFQLVHQEAGSPGAGAARLMILGQLAEEPGSTVSELARATGLAKSHVSTTVEYLVGRRWVEKCADSSDMRLVRIFPTEQAQQEFHRINAVVQQRFDAALSELTEQQVESMIAGLQALRAGLADGRRSGGI